MAEQTARANPHCKACGTRLSFSCGEIGPGCGAVIEPDWADLREMARNAGWTRMGSSRWAMWGAWVGEDIDDRHGWVIIHRLNRTWRFTIVGAGGGHKGSRSFAELIDPTPAQVLAAARLVGLVDAS